MNPDTKIRAIKKSVQIRDSDNVGFKQTEVGMIPEDWAYEALGNNVVINSGESPSKFKMKNSGVPYFKVEQLNHSDKYSDKSDFYIDVGISIPAGSIIFPKRGASIFLNKIRILKNASYMDTNLMTLTVSNGWVNEYVYYQLLHLGLWRIADTTSIPQINNKHINPFKIPLPPTKAEQTAIATALSDMDALIEAQEQLIAKKRAIKQGAMQELLKPKEGWVEKSVGECLSKIVGGGTPSRSVAGYWNGKIPWVTVKDFTNFNPYKTEEYITREGLDRSASNLIPEGTLITSTRMALGKVVVYNVDVAINQDLKALFVKRDILTNYLCYWFKNNSSYIEGLGSGSTVMGISLKELRDLKIHIPSSIAEQIEIANILSDMDTEIEQLETQLAKYRQVKVGMMQELLTGKKRLNH